MILIHKSEPIDGDVPVENAVLDNPRLTWKEKGLYVGMCRFRCGTLPIDFERVDFDQVVGRFGLSTFETLESTLRKLCLEINRKFPATRNFVYVATDASGMFKIGHTAGLAVGPRIESLRTGNPTLSLIGYKRAMKEEEQRLHRVYKKSRVTGEWFKLTINQVRSLLSGMVLCSVNHEQYS